MQKKDVSRDVFIDPVCWLEVNPDRLHFRATHLMRTYYFCSEACREDFEVNPDEYLTVKQSWYKRGWAIYFRHLKNTVWGIPARRNQGAEPGSKI